MFENFAKHIEGLPSNFSGFLPLQTARSAPTLLEPLEKAVKATGDYFSGIGDQWYADRKATEEAYQRGDITDAERGLRNVSGHITAGLAPFGDAIGTGLNAIGLGEVIAEGIEWVSETPPAQFIQEVAEEYPRASRNIESAVNVFGVATTAKILKSGINRGAASTETDLDGFYKKGATLQDKMKIAFDSYLNRFPGAIADAFNPRRSRNLRITGLSTAKRKLELGERRSKVKKEGDISRIIPPNPGAAAAGSNLARQARLKVSDWLENSAFKKAYQYKSLDKWDDATVRKELFNHKRSGGHLLYSIPSQIKTEAMKHINKVWNFKHSNTLVDIKRPDGPQHLGNEAIGKSAQVQSMAVRRIFDEERLIAFVNTKRKNKIKRSSSVTNEEFLDYLTANNIKFTREGRFAYVSDSHVSKSKESGGVNNFIAIDTKTNDVYSIISDKHDMFADIDPIGGQSLMTVMPMMKRNWKTRKEGDYEVRNKAEEWELAKKLEEETGIPISAKEKKRENGASDYNMRVLREYEGSAEIEDYIDVARRAGMTAHSGSLTRGFDKDTFNENTLNMLEEILPRGAKIDEDGMVTLYHRTSPESASRILETGQMIGKEDRLFFGTKPDGQISGYGDSVVEVKIPADRLELDDIFDNEAHLTLKSNFKPQQINVVGTSGFDEEELRPSLLDRI